MSHLGKSKSDEVPCRSCTSFTEYMKQNKKRYISDHVKSSDDDDNNNYDYKPLREDCPADSSALGKSTWTFLHTMAARYPDIPTRTEEKDMSTFLNIFAKVYPCPYCAEDLQKQIVGEPPRTESQEALSQWMCRLHNKVNVKLGKAMYDCSKINERWRDGWLDGSCD